ncbi:acyl carrier protein [Oribacterium sp. NK2B42]|uniref:acyl carrier protein n=1 Tax=Oribacterium sp. NK2B42 TaxID=689781 RepID=UPI0004093BEE|nr:acyl carrier protein [Oribacterium sp. NK2B42]
MKGKTIMSNREKYAQIFKDVFGVNDSELNEKFNFKEVEKWDSFAHLTLISELETTFDVMFETEDILHYGGYLNGMDILKRYGVEF